MSDSNAQELSHVRRCVDLREADIAAAVRTRADVRALLAHLAACSAPDTGVAKVLLVFARMATTACDWIDGDLTIDLTATADRTTVETATDLGGGMRERLLPTLLLNAPLSELTRAIERVPHLIAPLVLRRGKSGLRVRLSASAAVRRTTLPPPMVEIAPESLLSAAPVPPAPRAPSGADVTGISPPPLPVISVLPPRDSVAPTPGAPSEPPLTEVDGGWDD